jgi:cyanophycinase-like exopeptidase
LSAAALCACATLAGCSVVDRAAARGPGFRYYVVGNPADVERPTRGLWVAQGGGDHVNENYVRMGAAAGGGDFVVLRAAGTDEYNSEIFPLCGCDSVETIVLDGAAATADPFVIATIRHAEAVFISGGDQSNYIRYWKDTPVEDAINFVAGKPAPIGGTSAGMAVMGEFVYSAEGQESLTSAVALADPYAPDLTLARGFIALPWLENVLTDQHLQERDRIGRTVALLSRIQQDGWSARPRAIAADRETSVHIDPVDGTVEILATADHPTPYAYFLEPSAQPLRCAPGEHLTTAVIRVYRLGPGGRFNLRDWKGTGGIGYELRVLDGFLLSSRESNYGPVAIGKLPIPDIRSVAVLLDARSMSYVAPASRSDDLGGNAR